ncbi:unnamed protein product [Ilex paraguariensis]|uniref:Uncharacterized protein n=1 Tax=Ilex paraguariensis TaxID=185542 RepID=A0ABC8R0F4_9AQUA
MGSCLSKKSTSSSPSALPKPPDQPESNTQVEKKKPEAETVKKEIFVIKHRKSHERNRRSEEENGEVEKANDLADQGKIGTSKDMVNCGLSNSNGNGNGNGNGIIVAAQVRTSSCTKEEVESILIQCGRLSRSSSTGKAANSGSGGSSDNTNIVQRGRKYSGSKRSYDFGNEVGDHEKKNGNTYKGNGDDDNNVGDGGDDGAVMERIHRHTQRQRNPRSRSSSRGRRTPSRERDQQQQQQQRSGSRERGGSGGRRLSRSPGRRSESPTTSNGVTGATQSSGNVNSTGSRPGKMVSVPATVSSLVMDKSNNGGGAEPISAVAIKRIQVKRNVGDATTGSRSAASPRARSPARANVRASNENQNSQHQQQPLSLSRSNSRKAEQSPYRRNPLSEIDTNVVTCDQLAVPRDKAPNKNIVSQAPMQKPDVENVSKNKAAQGIDNKTTTSKGIPHDTVTPTCRANEQQLIAEEGKGQQPMTCNVAVNVISSGAESFTPQALTRSRSSRKSRDLDANPEALLNPTSSYTALLLEDIQNFHQKNTTNTPAFTLPPCVSKACSILEAVADLNSSTSSNLSCALSDDRRRNPTSEQSNKSNYITPFGANSVGKKRLQTKDPFVESEVVISDDLMQPSFHKYVTVRRGTMGDGDMEEQESSGSNSFVGDQQCWISSSWEATQPI